jgi:segregation and condensation protein B
MNAGFLLEQTAGGYRLATRPELDPFLRKFFSKQGEGRLSMAALETLSIIAYRQPITAPEISDIRGVNTSGVLRTLLDRKMIKIAGRKNVVGSPFLYRTTREFLVHFGLNSIQDLPRLEEFAEILGENITEEMLEGSGGGGEALEGTESGVAVSELSGSEEEAAATTDDGMNDARETDVMPESVDRADIIDEDVHEISSADEIRGEEEIESQAIDAEDENAVPAGE